MVIRGLGELCITAGLILMLFVTYELWGTGQYTRAQQDRLGRELLDTWKAPKVTTEKVRLGRGLAMIRIPRFGDGYHYVIIEGVDPADLRKGPGHYPGSAMPGEIGNFVVSGHRTTYSAPFNRLGELRAGDKILIDTRDRQFTYRVTGREIVKPSAVEVTAPVPGHPKKRPTEKRITLTTCHPKYSAAERMIIFGTMVSELPRAASTGK
ncbi:MULTISPECIES: class E sortase [Actinomadura]|uniref:Class E sortase n=1 Tax=Actinomadura litoris TaxID=2678616 RepID=A0A7K1L9Y1_9ACTN|nr:MULTISPECIES: class E sortase [Actinomadura]MBT2207076.1 class E sortase [Actinomadura sp. NEAU-AAG7]MUN41232.1 class E sortase [Actinomadura litoris]